MYTITDKKNCKGKEVKVSFKSTVTGETIYGCVSTEKQPFIIKNVTYFRGRHVRVTPFNKSISEKEIFDEYNQWEKDKDAFIMPPENNEIKVGMGSGALLGGLDKELTFKPVDKKTFDKVENLKKDRDNIEKIRDEHNFLFGDGNAEMMDKAREMEYENKRALEDATGWYL